MKNICTKDIIKKSLRKRLNNLFFIVLHKLKTTIAEINAGFK